MSGGLLTLPRLASGALLAGVAAWALWPLGAPAITAAAPVAAAAAARPSAGAPVPLDLHAFDAPLWVVPPAPPAPPAPPPPPPPLKLQLVAVVKGDGGALKALVYDPELDRMLTLGQGDPAGAGRTVAKIEVGAVVIKEGTLERRLTLDGAPAPAGGAP